MDNSKGKKRTKGSKVRRRRKKQINPKRKKGTKASKLSKLTNTRGRNGTLDANPNPEKTRLALLQMKKFRTVEKDASSPFGKLLTEVVKDSKTDEEAEGGMKQLRLYLEHHPDTLLDESDIVDESVWGYQFSKITMYYLVHYYRSVRYLPDHNPIRARVMGLVSSISFYLEACAAECLTRVRMTEEFATSKPSHPGSRMHKSTNGIREALNQNYDLEIQRLSWQFINSVLVEADVDFVTTNEQDPISAFGNLTKSFRILGTICAKEANKLFISALSFGFKQERFSDSDAKFATERRKNFRKPLTDRHIDCQAKYRILGQYVSLYFKMTSPEKADEKINIINICFGLDLSLDIAFELLKMHEKHLQFWSTCKLDLDFGQRSDLKLKWDADTAVNLDKEIVHFFSIKKIL